MEFCPGDLILDLAFRRQCGCVLYGRHHVREVVHHLNRHGNITLDDPTVDFDPLFDFGDSAHQTSHQDITEPTEHRGVCDSDDTIDPHVLVQTVASTENSDRPSALQPDNATEELIQTPARVPVERKRQRDNDVEHPQPTPRKRIKVDKNGCGNCGTLNSRQWNRLPRLLGDGTLLEVPEELRPDVVLCCRCKTAVYLGTIKVHCSRHSVEFEDNRKPRGRPPRRRRSSRL